MNLLFLEGDMSRKGGTERMTAFLANALSIRHSVFVISLRMAGDGVFFPLNGCVQHSVLDNGAGKTGAAAKIRMIRRFIKENKLGKVLPYTVRSGYAQYAAVAFDLEKLKEFDPVGVSEFKRTWNIPEKKPEKKPAKKKNRGMER